MILTGFVVHWTMAMARLEVHLRGGSLVSNHIGNLDWLNLFKREKSSAACSCGSDCTVVSKSTGTSAITFQWTCNADSSTKSEGGLGCRNIERESYICASGMFPGYCSVCNGRQTRADSFAELI